MPSLKPTLAPGQVLVDRYRIESILAKGGFSFIYLAHRLAEDDTVVVKVLHNEAMRKDPAARKRFKREAAIARNIDHPNHVTVFDYGATPGGHPFLVLERLHGQELLELYEARAPLSPEDVREILRQIMLGLVPLHDMDVAHRDLKPANVYVCETEDGSIHVKLLDYGLAKVLSGDGALEQANLTTKDIVVGTPGYLAPELLLGADVTTSVDLYAAGLIGYELYTGSRAYDGSLMDRAIAQSERDPAKPAAALRRSPLWTVIERLLQRKPERRYATAQDVISALDNMTLDAAAPTPVRSSPAVPTWVYALGAALVIAVVLALVFQ